MVQFLTASFFLLAFAGAMTVLHMTVRDHLNEILAALLGEMPPRRIHQPSWSRVKAAPRRRPVVLRVQHFAAAA